jgi:CcmD family protein
VTLIRKRLGAVFGVLAALLLTAPVLALQPPPQNEFVPIDKLPPAEQLPSAPLLIAAYAFVWIAVMFYVWTIWRRLTKVEADLETLKRKGGSSVR